MFYKRKMDPKSLISWIEEHLDPTYPLLSRVHPLKGFPGHSQRVWWVKREDELSFGISGSKYRKYASLIPAILKKKVSKVALVGSAYSNHIVGLLQLLNEKGLPVDVFLSENKGDKETGNRIFLKLLMGERLSRTVPKPLWAQKDAWILSQLEPNTFYIPEGAAMMEALPGALSLAWDLRNNQNQLGLEFAHVFIDAGTGFAAIALLLGMHFFQLKAHVHILLLADSFAVFHQKLSFYQKYLESVLQLRIPLPPYFLYHGSLGKAFGSTPKRIFQEIETLAREEGILTDPIYSAKLFYHAKEIVQKKELEGNLLCIHSGGGLTLSGFLENFAR
ncbi:MAG: pyridoxal-phosphate dependent enzyme [Chlamydiae bacterium]|nr:pyridoxal-phosphate dependent enzyme [Chlamydiota bacterium]